MRGGLIAPSASRLPRQTPPEASRASSSPPGQQEVVRAAVYDALGREVAVLHDGPLAAGTSVALSVETSALAPGVYIVRAQGESTSLTQRLTVAR